MAFSARQRWFVLGSALALTLGLAAWLGESPEEQPAETPAAKPPPVTGEKTPGPVQSGKVGQLSPQAAGQAGEIVDVFAPQSWKPAPQAQPQAEVASAPAEPEMPFTYFGKLIEGGRVTVYLATADRNLAVRKGDVIEGTWRLESIRPTALVFRNLALGTRKTLETGRAK